MRIVKSPILPVRQRRGTRLSLVTGDSETLEARWDAPDEPTAAIVFCHPHPRYGGTMHAPLMNAVADRLVAMGFGVLRFNFRGAGDSSGHHGGGRDEVADVDAAYHEAKERHPDVALAGWSFGGAMVLTWQATVGNEDPLVAIAPAVALAPTVGLAEARRRIILGDRDQLIEPDLIREYAATIGADLAVLEGSDHFFYFRHHQVADLIGEWVSG